MALSPAARYRRGPPDRECAVSVTADRIPPLLAAELARQYDILRALGKGGMGVVLLARERSLDRLVAIKVLSGEGVETGDVRERFRREARIAARLMHPNIVPLHAFGETEDALYLVMGYVEGETLAARLEREGRVPRQASLRILAEIADALAFAHIEGVVHRDVKPENILLQAKTGRAMLADFGIARADGATTSVTMTGMTVGTPSYMSPEQAAGMKDIDGRSDVYSLAVVGYRMLAGRLPFTATSLQALLAQHAVAKPDDLALVVARPDRGVARVIMRGLEKDPGLRWARAEDLREMLRAETEESPEMPEELDRIDGTGTKMLVPLSLFGAGLYLLSVGFSSGPEVGMTFEAIFAATLAAITGIRALPAARSFGWHETLRTLFHPPRWWSSWWPRAFRRADDQWDRLPPVLRRFRAFRDATVTLWVGLFGVMTPLFFARGGPALGVLIGITGAFWLGAVATIAGARASRKALTALGLSEYEAAKAGALPNVASHPKWKNPQFSRLLAPESQDASESRRPRTPAELVSAIEELSARLQRGGLLPDDECALAAQSVKTAIDALVAEVVRLNQELDPAERERLDRRTAALGDGDEDAELRGLLESQRAVWRRLDQRRQEKEARRDRLRDQLMTLWMQLLDLDARVMRGSPVDPQLTGQVRALSQDLAHAGDALAETERWLARPERETFKS